MSTSILQFATDFTLYSGCIAFGLGIIGNALNILVFTKLKLFQQNRCAFYLIIESISDFIYQFIPVTITILTSIYGDDGTGRSLFWCKFRYIYGQFFGLIPYYIVSFAAIDQFLSTHYQFNFRNTCTLKMTRYFTLVFICFSLMHSIMFSLFFDIQPGVGCVISNPIWLQYATYFFYPLLAGLIPITSACFFGILAYRNVRRIIRRQIPIERRRLDRQMTAMVLIRVIIFVCFATPYTSYRIYAINSPLSKSKPLEYAIGRLIQSILYFLIILNYAISFYIFLALSTRFRRQVKLVLVKKCWQKLKLQCFSSHNQVVPDHRNSRVITDMDLERNS